MLEVIREQFLIYGSMENYLTAGDLALIENRRGWNNGCYYGGDYGHYHQRSGMAATGIGLAAGLGGAALLGVLAIVGVLSVGAIAGYSKAMMKYKLN